MGTASNMVARQDSKLTEEEKVREDLPEIDEQTGAQKLTLDRMMTFTLFGRKNFNHVEFDWAPPLPPPMKTKKKEVPVPNNKKKTVLKDVTDCSDCPRFCCARIAYQPVWCQAFCCKFLPTYCCKRGGDKVTYAFISLYLFYFLWMWFMITAGTTYPDSGPVMISFMAVFVVSILLTGIGLCTFTKNNETQRREEENRRARALKAQGAAA